jgi:hypothetical protein
MKPGATMWRRRDTHLAIMDRATFLWLLETASCSIVTWHLEITQEEIGAISGISRQNANRCLKTLKQEGVLRREYGGVTIVDLERLRSYGEQLTGRAFRPRFAGGSTVVSRQDAGSGRSGVFPPDRGRSVDRRRLQGARQARLQLVKEMAASDLEAAGREAADGKNSV